MMTPALSSPGLEFPDTFLFYNLQTRKSSLDGSLSSFMVQDDLWK